MASKNPTTKKRLTGDERRRRLIDAAVDLFSQHGFKGTATKQIADHAGVNETLLFRDFGTKQGLYTAILDQKAEDSQTEQSLEELHLLAEQKDDWAFVRSLVGKILEAYRSNPRHERLMLYAALEGHELSTIFNETTGRPIFEFLAKYVAQRQQDGAFREGDPRGITFALFGLPTYYAIVRRLYDMDVLELSDDEAADLFTEIVLNGLVKPTSKDSKKKQLPRNGRRK